MFNQFLRAAAVTLTLSSTSVSAANILFTGGTIIAFNRNSQSLEVIRNGSLLVQGDRIATIFPTGNVSSSVPTDIETIDCAGQIIAPGMIDTHRHGWMTAMKTLASNTTLAEYFVKFLAPPMYTADDVYIGQLAGLYEALDAGVTTTLDHAHSTWSDEVSPVGLQASVDSGARVFWAYGFRNLPDYRVNNQLPIFEQLVKNAVYEGSATSLAVAWDSFGDPSVLNDTKAVIEIIRRHNISVLTTHTLEGPWGVTNSPKDLFDLGLLDTGIAVVFSHASFLTYQDASLLRQTNQYISITVESEMHYGHTDPVSHLVMDQASLGIDTHFTFSTDILTQA
ncbi:hypothetical protein BKA62DRAFT_691494 [Auriculariales sp. MPI-PUGE-AT-0066]|nr:hypothetical protein BKA62DRAFT_691494 [Auriculariales sp. MPI-PUGE-AT-0066]